MASTEASLFSFQYHATFEVPVDSLAVIRVVAG